MADNLQAVRDLFKKADVSLLQKDVWEVQGIPVVKHKALERLAGALKIKFRAPQILRSERDEAVLLVTGEIDSLSISEWSIGEACVNVNYRVTGKMAAYVYAMAEKRAKDRVILKLAGLHGVYSEDEADDFKAADAPTMSDRLFEAEKRIDEAAKIGVGTVEAVWNKIDSELQDALRAKVKQLVIRMKTATPWSGPNVLGAG